MRPLIVLFSINLAFGQTPPYPYPLKPSPATYTSIHDVNLRKVLGIGPNGLYHKNGPDEEFDTHYKRMLQLIDYLPGESPAPQFSRNWSGQAVVRVTQQTNPLR